MYPTLLALLFSFNFVRSAPASSQSHEPTWRSLAPISILPRQEHSTVFLPPSTIAILGGIVPTNDSNIFPPVATTPLMQFYSITKNDWSTRAPLPQPMNHINAAVVKSKIYILGGLVEDSEPGRAWRAIPGSWVYDPALDAWSEIEGMPVDEARGSAAVGVYDSKVYLAGGMTDLELYGNNSQNTVAVVSIYDTASQAWLEVPEAAKYMPEGRDHAGAAVVGSKMYVLGGRDHGQVNVRDQVFILDLCNLEAGWKISGARMPTARGGIATGVVGNRVYTFGGEGNTKVESGVFDEVEAYDTVSDIWESVGTMKIPRHGTYAVGVGGGIYIPGGGVRQSGMPVADFDVFVP